MQCSMKVTQVVKMFDYFKAVCDDFNLLQYFQEQRLEHTRLLRKEIYRLEILEKVYLSAIKQVRSFTNLVNKAGFGK